MKPEVRALLVAMMTLGSVQAVEVELRELSSGFTSPVAAMPHPMRADTLLVVDQVGVIYHVNAADGSREEAPFLDIRDRMVKLNDHYDERGLLGLAFHPKFADNGKFYIHYSAPMQEWAPEGYNHIARVSEFRVGDAGLADSRSERIVFRIAEPQMNHNGGSLGFGPDGLLYIALGDGGGANDVGFGHTNDWYEAIAGGNGQNISTVLGKIVRIDVDREEQQEFGRYGIPQDNPFVGQEGLDEIWAYGFRNPYRFAFNPDNPAQLFVGDAGQELWEEISLAEKGGNYGWNVKEGTHCFNPDEPKQPRDRCPSEDVWGRPLLAPIIEHPNHKIGGPGLVIIGGYRYRGKAMPALENHYLYGFWTHEHRKPSGRLFHARQEKGEWIAEPMELASGGPGIGEYLLAYGWDADGEPLVLTSNNEGPMGRTGKVFRLTQAGARAE